MRRQVIAVGEIAVRDLPGGLGILAKAQARAQDLHVVIDLFERGLIERFLRARGPARPGVKGAREIRIIAVAADHIGVERHQIACADHMMRAFLKPRVGPGAGIEQPGLAVIAIAGDHRLMHHRPELVLGHPRPQGRAQLAHRRFGRAQAGADAFHLFRRFDRAGHFHRRLRVRHREPLFAKRNCRAGVQPLHAHLGAAADKPGNQIAHFRRPVLFARSDLRPGGNETGGACRAHFVDGVETIGQMQAAGEFEQDRAVGGQQQITRRRIAHRKHLHVAGAGGVADVDRVREDHRAEPACRHLMAQPVAAIVIDRAQVDAGTFRRAVEQRNGGQIAALGVPVEICHGGCLPLPAGTLEAVRRGARSNCDGTVPETARLPPVCARRKPGMQAIH